MSDSSCNILLVGLEYASGSGYHQCMPNDKNGIEIGNSVPQKRTRQLFMLVDGYSLIFRAYHSMGEMSAPDGTPTGALFGLSLMLIRAIEEFKPDYLVVAFDAHGPTFRHKQYTEY